MKHELAVDKLMGEVRALFPGDRATQNAIFPELASRSTADDVEEELETPDEIDEEPVADPTSTP